MQIELLEASFDQIRPQAIAFSARFYDLLFHHHPELKPLFAETTQEAMGKKLMVSLAAIVENLRSPEILTVALQSLGARHVQVGTLEEHYPFVGQALLETFAEYLGSDWTPELATAWQDAYGVIVTIMLQGAEDPESHLEPELTFYDWIDLYGESSPRIRDAMAGLTDFHYGNRPDPDVVKDLD